MVICLIWLKMTSRKVDTVFATSGNDMDDNASELLNGNARGTVQSGFLYSSLETNSDTTLPLTPNGCEENTQMQVKDVRPVVQPSDINQNALQESSNPDPQDRELWPVNGPGKVNENQNVAIENHNDFH